MNVRDNPLVEMAEEAKRPSPWWLAWLIAIIIIVAAGGTGQLVGAALLGDPTPDNPIYQYTEVFVFGFTLIALFLWVRLKEGRPVSSVGFRGTGAAKKFAFGWLLGAIWMSVGVLIATLLGQFSPHRSVHTISGAAALLPLIPLIIFFCLQGSTEEAVTRGYMLQMGGRQLPGWVAILGSAAVFAVVHVTFEPIVLVNLVLYAVFASLIALEQGSLWLISGFHAGWNLTQTNILGLPDSGNPAATSIFSFGPTEGSTPILHGGGFGIEGGLVTTFLFGIAAAVAFVRYRRTRSTTTEPPAVEKSPRPA